MRIAHMMMGEVAGETASNTWHCPMMFGFKGTGVGWMWLSGFFWFTTWVLVIAVLIALLRWLWKGGDK